MTAFAGSGCKAFTSDALNTCADQLGYELVGVTSLYSHLNLVGDSAGTLGFGRQPRWS